MFRIASIALAAINRAQERIHHSAGRISRAGLDGPRGEGRPGDAPSAGPPQRLPAVDLAREIVDLKIAQAEIKANLKSIQTEDEVTGALLDIKS